MSAWIAQHRKLIAAVAGAVVTVVVQVWGTSMPWVTALILIATAAGVYRAPNEPQSAPAAPALPDAPGGRGTRAVRVIPGGPPPPFLGSELGERPSQSGSAPVIPSAGTSGPVTGARP